MDINGRPNHIQDVIIRLHTGQWYDWSDLKNKVYENLVILGGQEKPTKEFLESELARLQSEHDAQGYARTRAPAYPSLGDQLDMLWHAIDANAALKTRYADFHTAIKTVKDANPKP